jgi:hypothetical protein
MVPSVASEKIPSDTTGDRSRDLPLSYIRVKHPHAAVTKAENVTKKLILLLITLRVHEEPAGCKEGFKQFS